LLESEQAKLKLALMTCKEIKGWTRKKKEILIKSLP
jgi:predicted GIY-YIG superfamily endonuclease